MLKAIVLNLVISKLQLDAFLVIVQSLSLVQINGQSEQKSAVARQNSGHNRYIHYSVSVTCTTGRVQQIQNLDDKLRKVLNGKLGTVEQHLGFVLLVLDVIHT